MFNQMVEHSQESLTRVFSAVADPTRRAILQALARNPETVTGIAKPFSVSLNAVSKHLMVLERAGLIRREIRGREHLCTLEARPLRDCTAWLDHYRHFWDVRLDALEHYVARRAKDPTRKRGAHGGVH
jgi:DNA-binding transcriptional ArsR family regulator